MQYLYVLHTKCNTYMDCIPNAILSGYITKNRKRYELDHRTRLLQASHFIFVLIVL